MKSKRSISLLWKMLIWLLLHLAVIALVVVALGAWHFHSGLDVLLRGSAGDRLRASGEQIGSQLRELPRREWEPVMKTFAEEHGVACDIWMPHGDWATHTISEVPEEVMERLNRDRPPPPPQRPQHYESDRRPPSPDRPGPPGENRPPPRDKFVQRDPMGPDDRSMPPREPSGPQRVNEFQPARPLFFLADKKQNAYWAAVHVPLQAGGGPDHVVWLIRSESLSANGLLFDITPWVMGAVSLLLFSILFWVPFALSITRYVKKLKNATDLIADGCFDIDIDARRADELGSLGRAITTMSSRIDHLLKGQKRFLGDVAHELCSPLARLRTGIGILETKLPQSEQIQLEHIEEEAQELANLVDELLAFSRASSGNKAMKLQAVAVLPILQKIIERELPELAVDWQITAAISVMAEPRLLHRAFSNILRNVVRHAGEHPQVAIHAQCDHRMTHIVFIDNGPGVPEHAVSHLFDPFYRPDISRTRDTGGVGLGLTIVKTCIEACGGKVAAENRLPSGFQIMISLDSVA